MSTGLGWPNSDLSPKLKKRRRDHSSKKHHRNLNNSSKRRKEKASSKTPRNNAYDYSSDTESHDSIPVRRQGMSYITEEDTEEAESSICDDVIAPVIDDGTSITFSERGVRRYYINSNDELVNPEDDENYPENWYAPLKDRQKFRHKLYRQREIEATKFVETVNKAVKTFKKQRIKFDHRMNIATNLANDKTTGKLTKVKNDRNRKENSKTRKAAEIADPMNGLPNVDTFEEEKSVRLNDSRNEGFPARKDSDRTSTWASETVRRSKKNPKILTPTPQDLKCKNDYIFFELLSVFTENFVDDSKKNKSKRK